MTTTTIELAKQAFSDPNKEPAFKNGFYTITPEELEAFRALCVAERDKELMGVGTEPVAYSIFAENGNIRLWSTEPQHVKRIAEDKGLSLVTLHTAEQLAAARLQGAKEQAAHDAKVEMEKYELLVASEQRIEELESTVAEQLRTINAINDSGKPTLTVIQQLDAKDQRIAELEAELLEQARVNGMGAEREAKLMARVAVLEAQFAECKDDAARWRELDNEGCDLGDHNLVLARNYYDGRPMHEVADYTTAIDQVIAARSGKE